LSCLDDRKSGMERWSPRRWSSVTKNFCIHEGTAGESLR
jgi:hypothetical protein